METNSFPGQPDNTLAISPTRRPAAARPTTTEGRKQHPSLRTNFYAVTDQSHDIHPSSDQLSRFASAHSGFVTNQLFIGQSAVNRLLSSPQIYTHDNQFLSVRLPSSFREIQAGMSS